MNQGVSPANDDGPCAPFALSSYGTPASPSWWVQLYIYSWYYGLISTQPSLTWATWRLPTNSAMKLSDRGILLWGFSRISIPRPVEGVRIFINK
jgi:hypothetical protein